ncbi:non-ribosomal peptide synthetase [Pseudodesulfovibrio piezophilus]|uniref:Putative AMP-binding enzyme n=1 Tax=Pseudodesulfovibrio piezophilus (strain DSM 21447 / JCM 15486 / C1TLV30) TaxID=1322246 RepID=M1WRS7_PSEP2|nr:non-ribosomal peptide synthetase [Pseudodesulfovibrio piezophilus]CCH48482.1 putative AMP-binding enzyme [Pseudodesulfovibrio piezophilus C1TLV30]
MYTTNPVSSHQLVNTLTTVLEETAIRFPDKGITYVNPSGSTEDFQSYPQLLFEGKATAHVLYKKGFKPGDHLIIAVDDSKSFLNIFWGCLYGGIIPAPVSHIRTPNADSMEIQKIVNIQGILDAPVIAESSNIGAFRVLEAELAKRKGELLASETLLNEAELADITMADFYTPSPNDIAVLQFSSGSMGMPKGAKLTHRNLLANIIALQNVEQVTDEDTMVSWLPYFHDFGLFGCHLMPLHAGMKQVKMSPFQFAQRPFLWMQKIHEHKATATSTTNTGVEHLLSYIKLRKKRLPEVDLSCLKTFTVGAEMISAQSCIDLEEALGPMGFPRNIIMPGYGLTETTLVATCHPNGLPIQSSFIDREAMASRNIARYVEQTHANAAQFTNVGPAVSFCHIRIVDSEGKELPEKHIGEVQISGENVITEYHNAPEATAQSFHDEWFATGDLGFMNKEKELFIVGRGKELIIVRGQNYYPADIEKIALTGLEENFRVVVACAAYNDKTSREETVLFYIPANKKENLEETAHALMRINENVSTLAGFSIDHFIPMKQAEIPRTSSGKIMRKYLSEQFRANAFSEKALAVKEALAKLDAPANPETLDHETVVREAWSDVLALDGDTIDQHKNLFKLGGDSIRAMRIQARLEDTYGVKIESNFCYLFSTIAAQTAYFETRDFSIEPPQNELEAIVQKIVANHLGVPNDTVGVTENLIKRIGSISDMLAIVEEIKHCFAEVPFTDAFLQCSTLRGMAEYLWPLVFPAPGEQEDEFLPLMHFQETLYFHHKGFVRNEPSGLSCYIYLNANMTGQLDLPTFNKALNYVVSRHPVLRTVIDEEQAKPRMRVLAEVPEIETGYIEQTHLSEKDRAEYIRLRGLEHNDYRFDVTQWPLFFCEITKFEEEKHVFMMNIDHLLVDGYSYMQVFEELFNTYDRMRREQPWELEPPQMTFGDYVRIEGLRQRTAEYQQAMKFQLEVFKDLPDKATLPFRRNPAMLKKVEFDTFYQEIEPEIINELNSIAMEHQISLNAMLLAAYFKLMNIWCHQDDLIINMPVFNREQYFAGARKTVGSFIDIFPVRLKTSFEEPILDIAKKAEAFTRKLLEVPVSSIELSRRIFEREGRRATSMSSIIFSNSIGMYAGEVSKMESLKLDTPEFRTGAPGTFIDLVIYDYRARMDQEDTYYFNWNYIRDSFDIQFIQIISEQYETLLQQVISSSRTRDEESQFTCADIIPEQYRSLIENVNQTAVEIPEKTLHELIGQTMEKHPDKTAITSKEQTISYQQFNTLSGDVARTLAQHSIGKGDFAALYMGRDQTLPMAQLGAMRAGAAYVPIDIDYPIERIAYVLADSGARVLLTQSHLLGALQEHLKTVELILVMNEDVEPQDIPSSLREKTILPHEVFTEKQDIALPICTQDDLAYMLYTSGSTGNPKGVMVTHRNIVNFLHWVHREIGISQEERMALLTSYAFDMTLTSNWTAFLAGATLHILSEEDTKDVKTLLLFLQEKDITFLNVTPSHFSLIANAREYISNDSMPLYPTMRVMLGGEIINTKDLNLWLSHYPQHRFINEYGPTETTVASTFFPIPVTDENTIDLHTVPIGKPVYNTEVHILDADMNPCMVGVPGELCIGGMGVTNGYHQKLDKNETAFVPNPFDDGITKIYRTGDVVRMLSDGTLQYLGRNDHQINLRGYRIEAGEIEAAMRAHESVTEVVIVPREDISGSLVLVAFYTGPHGQAETPSLRAFLAKGLPEYMIPSHFEHLERMPCTPSGKLDIKGLPEVTITAEQFSDGSETPTTDLELQIAAIWEDVLGMSGLGLNNNFWDVGGDSLKAMRLIMRMKKEGYIDFGLREAFQYQTIASIVEHIEKQHEKKQAESDILTLSSRQFPLAQVFCLPYACGNPTMYRELAAELPTDYTILAANMPGHGKEGEPLDSIESLAAMYTKHLSERAQETPLFLVGYSFGGHIAYEIARTLEAHGTPASGVVIISSPPPGVLEGLNSLLSSSDEELLHHSKSIYKYDFSQMIESERDRYLATLRVDTSAMVNHPFAETLATPVLIVTGKNEEEPAIHSKARDWEKAFSKAQYRELNGTHMLIKTHVSELAKHISNFIDELSIT